MHRLHSINAMRRIAAQVGVSHISEPLEGELRRLAKKILGPASEAQKKAA